MAAAIKGPVQGASEARCAIHQILLRDRLPAAAVFAHEGISGTNLSTLPIDSRISKCHSNIKLVEQAVYRRVNRREMKSPAHGKPEQKEGCEVKRS